MTVEVHQASLRRRLGIATALGAFLLSLVATLLVGFERWQEESNSLQAAVELEAFRLAELSSSDQLIMRPIGGSPGFVAMLDRNVQTMASVGAYDRLAQEVSEEIWTQTTEQELIYGIEYQGQDGTEIYAAGVACVDQSLCDSVVVGRTWTSLDDFGLARLPWLLGPSLAMAAAAFVATRWIVGRALRSVEAMRSELAAITATSLDNRVPRPGTGDELDRLATTLNDTLARLQVSSEATQRFAADAAHELRSPITGVRAAVELRADDDELLGQALGELDRANRLIDDLLVLAKRQKATPVRVEVDLDDIVGSDVSAAGPRFPKVEFTTSLQPARISGDPDALRRIVANVLENAAGHCHSSVRVTLQREADHWLLQVDDDGPGIPPADRDRVFERFARLDQSRSRLTGGSGLGLALVSELVADHNGTVSVDDGPLGGARFEIKLPTNRPA